jgi:hypothetical protein
MAVGGTEIVTNFEAIPTGSGRPTISGQISACGKCGAVIFPGFEATHASWHNTAGWSQQAMTTRVARGPYEQNSP